MRHAEHLADIIGFLRGIGLRVVECALPQDTFLPGLELRDGVLHVDASRLEWPGDLLHEAGHLAVLPAALREREGVFDDAHEGIEHAGENEAMAWAWAASRHLGLPDDVLIHDGGYHGRAHDVRAMYALGIVPGLRGLCESGLCSAPGFGENPADGFVYPAMRRWLRE